MTSPEPLSPGKRRLFGFLTFLFPFLVLGAIEATLRVIGYGSSYPLFERVPNHSKYLRPSQTVARRYFPSQKDPPRPSTDSFLVDKPKHSFRVFALGESTTAGFPYPPKAMFTREIEAALHDLLPADTVEVVNLGIEATNSYAIGDFADEVIDQHPDAVLIYAGHNEYYGALGSASTGKVGEYPWLVRFYLKVERWRLAQVFRSALTAAAGGKRAEAGERTMRAAAQDQLIVLGTHEYRTGLDQFDKNLTDAIASFRRAGIHVYVGSLVSNLRDQPPLASLSTGGREGRGAAGSFEEAREQLSNGDPVEARKLFVRARDLDELRFRAPSDFNTVIQRVAKNEGATYVPVEEMFSAQSQRGIPGHDLILEHVHPNSAGYSLMARAFFSSMESSGQLKRGDFSRVRSWASYEKGRGITTVDEATAAREVQKVVTRWPFVPFTGPSSKPDSGEIHAAGQ
jgi:lysophospholipase L1-like esterase